MRYVARVLGVCAVALASCRCGGSTSSEPAQPSNEQVGVAYGLDWLPSDTVVVARFAPGYGPLADYLETQAAPADCVMALLRAVTATYMVHRYIADPPVTVVDGELDRDEAERCLGTALGVQIQRVDDDSNLSLARAGDRQTWIGWGEGRVMWHEDLERLIEVFHAADRVAPDSRMGLLVERLPSTGAGVVATVDLTSPIYSVRSLGFVTSWVRGEVAQTRLLFVSDEDAETIVSEKARRDEEARQCRENAGCLGARMSTFLEFQQDRNELNANFNLGSDHPHDLIRLADFLLVPTSPP